MRPRNSNFFITVKITAAKLKYLNFENVKNSLIKFLNFYFLSPFLDPISLSLSTALGNIMLQLQNQTLEEKLSGEYLALPKVVLVISQSQRISQMDYESAQRILLGSMLQFPDLYFVFLANDIDTFRDLTSRDGSFRMTSGRMVSFKLVFI